MSGTNCICKEHTILSNDEKYTVWSLDPENAALKFAEIYNEENVLLDEVVDIIVICPIKEKYKYKISAEVTIEYHANKCT